MLILAIGGVLVGFAFLVVSLVTENSTWAWGCIVACVAAAAVLFIDARSRRSGRSVGSPDVAGAPVQAADPIVEVGVPMDDDARSADATNADAATDARDEQPTTVRTEMTALEEPSVEPHHHQATAVEPDRTQAPVPVPAVVPGPEPEPTSEATLAAFGPVHAAAPAPPVVDDSEPDAEDADPTDVLVVSGLEHAVLVVDEHPRFHVPGCTWLVGRETMSLPAREAVELGFTPCSRCAPAGTLASLARA